MLTDDLLDQPCFKGERSDLDCKAERYPFAGSTDESKALAAQGSCDDG